MLKIGDKVFRNLPEQVGYNTEQIEKIFETLDGLNVQDNVVSVPDMSYVLTDDELKIVRQAVAFIIYSGELYIKRSEDSTLARFELVFSISESAGVISLSSKEIQVTLANGGLALVASSATTYNATKLDTLLNAKANLSGANFSGPITSPSIIENMAGYGFSYSTVYGYTFENVYVGAVKNGNKLTLICAFNITRTEDDVTGNPQVGSFVIPSSVGEKLFPAQVGNYTYLANKVVTAWKEAWTAADVKAFYNKSGNAGISLSLIGQDTAALTKNAKYYIRAEVTFLLSDSLV